MFTTDMGGTPTPGGPPVPVYLGNGWVQLLDRAVYYGQGVAVGMFGTGPFSLQAPDNGVSGGNARGAGAVDLQTSRSAAAEVASGANAVLLGGSGNTASGARAIAGGNASSASGADSVALGSVCLASASFAVAFGRSNSASGISSTVFGQSCVASGAYSLAHGFGATTRGIVGANAKSAATISTAGDSQHFDLTLRKTTTATSAAELTVDGGAVSATNVPVLPNNSSHHFCARVTARNTASVGSGSWRIEGTIERGANAAATALVGATTITAFGISASIGAPTVDVIANTTQGAPSVQVTPANTDSTKWVAEIVLIQIA